jgi:phosphatidylinositol alpha-1,6-mannosyltransferase
LIPFIRNCFTRIAKELEDLKFVIVGSDPKESMAHQLGYKERIVDCLKEEGLDGRVVLMGSVPEDVLISLYQHCEALVLPVIPVEGDVEGFGIVAIEASAAGRPVVAFDEGGISDAVLHGKTGLLVPSGHYEAMTEALKSLLGQSQPFHSSMRGDIERTYGWGSLVGQHRDFLLSDVS